MNPSSLLSRLFVAAVTLAAATASADNIALGGTIASTLSLQSSALPAASALDLGGEGSAVSDEVVHVADLQMDTNNATGLTLTVSSGSLSKAGGTSIPFQVTTVGDGDSAPAAGAFSVASGSNYTFATVGAGQNESDLYILYSAPATNDPGEYSGSITVTVADN